ncbi:MAG: hypothetical protein QOE11_2463 [Solirubrobacteraceae bacterium]|jgi:hypothetical protein|nr:hypothetical protein [Solirubrobacteraceae bacterium]
MPKRPPSPDGEFADAPLGSRWETPEDHGTLRAIAVWDIDARDLDREVERAQIGLAKIDADDDRTASLYQWTCNWYRGEPGDDGGDLIGLKPEGDPLQWRGPVADALRADHGRRRAGEDAEPTVTLPDGRVREITVLRLAPVRLEGELPGDLSAGRLWVAFDRVGTEPAGDRADERTRWVLCRADGEPVAVFCDSEWDHHRPARLGWGLRLIAFVAAACLIVGSGSWIAGHL